jgi:molybdenum cofactor cytidylyltransferase
MQGERNSCGMVILAAGAARRMGRPKQLLVWRGKTLLEHSVETALAADLGPVIVVLGAYEEQIAPHLASYPVFIVKNQDWERGMSTSIIVGLQKMLELNFAIQYVLFMAADQPLLNSAYLYDIWQNSLDGHKLLGVSSYEGVLGIPAVFNAALFTDLMALEGDRGARQIIQAHAKQALVLPCPTAALDLDTPQSWEEFLDEYG